MQETWVRSPGQEDLVEKEMAIHSNTLAWKIPWTGEPGRLSLWGHKESDTTERLHFHFHFVYSQSHRAIKTWELELLVALESEVQVSLQPGRTPGSGRSGGCHCCSCSVVQSGLTLCDAMDCSAHSSLSPRVSSNSWGMSKTPFAFTYLSQRKYREASEEWELFSLFSR